MNARLQEDVKGWSFQVVAGPDGAAAYAINRAGSGPGSGSGLPGVQTGGPILIRPEAVAGLILSHKH